MSSRKGKSNQLVNGCLLKNKYETEAKAQEVIDHAMTRHNPPELNTYKCSFCKGYHLTRVKE